MRKQKILVVDDNPLALKFAKVKLESAGYEVITHHGALGTLGIILQKNPDYVLMDVMMPGLSGDQLVSLILDNKIYKETETKFLQVYSGYRRSLLELSLQTLYNYETNQSMMEEFDLTYE